MIMVITNRLDFIKLPNFVWETLNYLLIFSLAFISSKNETNWQSETYRKGLTTNKD